MKGSHTSYSLLAYHFDPPTSARDYTALLKVASGVGVELRALRGGAQPGCDAYVIIPPSPWDGILVCGSTPHTPTEYILALRRLAPVRNWFLWYTRKDTLTAFPLSESYRYATTAVADMASFLVACCETRIPLSKSALCAAQRSLQQREARFLRHEVRGHPHLPNRLRREIVRLLKHAISRGELDESSLSSDGIDAASRRQMLAMLEQLEEGH